MALNTICGPCERGDHKRHYRVVQAVPEGMMGGAVCTCQGECRDGRYKDTRIPQMIARFLAAVEER